MSHVTIIISRSAPAIADTAHELEPSYEYSIPVPHDATPAQVGEMVRKAFKRLEDTGD